MLSVILSACQSGTVAKKLDIELTDFMITPSQFTVQAGTEVTIHVTNHGSVDHDFNIMKVGADIGDMFDEVDEANVLWEVDLQAGETKSQTFLVPDEPGAYQIACAMPGHVQSGMLGTLEVVK
jgi:uncharacterized cupredoxin-like copper-binding protein